MNSLNARTRALPIAFRAPDVEGRCKPVPVVKCPRRNADVLLAVCSQCQHASKVAFESDRVPVLLCDSDRGYDGRALHGSTLCIRDVMRPATLCIAGGSAIGVLLPHLALALGGVVPVLDFAGRPVGALSVARLREALRAGLNLEATADALSSEPWETLSGDAALDEAAERFAAGASEPLLVLGPSGALLGVLCASDLEP
jgi:CBS domain-containing protein